MTQKRDSATDIVRDYLAYCTDPNCPGDDCYGGDCPCGHHSAHEAWAAVYSVVDAARRASGGRGAGSYRYQVGLDDMLELQRAIRKLTI